MPCSENGDLVAPGCRSCPYGMERIWGEREAVKKPGRPVPQALCQVDKATALLFFRPPLHAPAMAGRLAART